MSARVTVHGARELAASLDTFADALERSRRGQEESAALLVSRMRQSAPARTGALRASIGPRGTPPDLRVVVGVRYAAPVISGVPSRGIRPNRFAERTAQASESAISQIFERVTQADADQIRGA